MPARGEPAAPRPRGAPEDAPGGADTGAGTGPRYGLLLALIVASMVVQLAAPTSDAKRVALVALEGATLVVALHASGARPLLVRGALLVVGLALVGSASAALVEVEGRSSSIAVVTLLLVAVAPAAVGTGLARRLRATGDVDVATIFGVLCLYLLLGVVFAFLYGAIHAFAPDSLFAQDGRGAGQADFLYFSFTTLTTTGYGDFTPAPGLARAMAISEALLGQIYLVTVVAAIVSNLRPRRVEAPSS